MALSKYLAVNDLKLDLGNYRTVKQSSELKAIHALIAIETDWFWELMRSLLSDGYLPVETIVVQKNGEKFIVKEGNRRIAALKLAFGYVKRAQFDLPSDIDEMIAGTTKAWKDANEKVPCTVYAEADDAVVDRVVSLIHGKKEKAGRSNWASIAKARHNRDKNGASEPALDMLEKYLKVGQNLTHAGRDRWAGDYPYSVLDEALKLLAPRLGFGSAKLLAVSYPNIANHRNGVEDLIRDIGLSLIDFKKLRSKTVDFAEAYGLPPIPQPPPAPAPKSSSPTTGANPTPSTSPTAGTPSATPTAPVSTPAPAGATSHPQAPAAAINTGKAVINTLQMFSLKGAGNSKIVALLEEIRSLTLSKHPHAFCFLLRCMFELSAKVFCDQHVGKVGAPKAVEKSGQEKTLLELLKGVANYMGANDKNNPASKKLHGAMTELANPHSILSVKSLNQLMHSTDFAVSEQHIAVTFHNVYPLLEALNE